MSLKQECTVLKKNRTWSYWTKCIGSSDLVVYLLITLSSIRALALNKLKQPGEHITHPIICSVAFCSQWPVKMKEKHCKYLKNILMCQNEIQICVFLWCGKYWENWVKFYHLTNSIFEKLVPHHRSTSNRMNTPTSCS